MQINHRRSRKQFFHQLPPAEHPPVDPPPDPHPRVATIARLELPPHPGGLIRFVPPEVAGQEWNYTRKSRLEAPPFEEPHPGAVVRTRAPDVAGRGWHYTRQSRTARTRWQEPHPGSVARTRPPETAGMEWNIPPRYRRADLMPLLVHFQQPVNVLREFRKLQPRRPALRTYVNANLRLPPLAYPAFAPRRTLMPDPVFFLRRIAWSPETITRVRWLLRRIPRPPFVPRIVAHRFVLAEAPRVIGRAWRRRIRDRGDILRLRRVSRTPRFVPAELLARAVRGLISHELLTPIRPRMTAMPDAFPRPAVARRRKRPVEAHYRALARAVFAHYQVPQPVRSWRTQLLSGAGPVIHARRVQAVPAPAVWAPLWRKLLLVWNTGDIVHCSRYVRSPSLFVTGRAVRRVQYRTGLSSASVVVRRERPGWQFVHEQYWPRRRLRLVRPHYVLSVLADILVRPAVLADVIVSVECSDAPRRMEY